MKIKFLTAKWLRFEYWPSWMFYLPLLPVWLVLSVRNRSMSFFTHVNPGIHLGGFFGESKQAILSKIPINYLPQQQVIWLDMRIQPVGLFQEIEIGFPFIIKPDIGERGTAVAKILAMEDWINYCALHPSGTYIVQTFIDFPEEFGILYSRSPSEEIGKITSITRKKFLTVRGDGKQTIGQLLNSNLRGAIQRKRLLRERPEIMEIILEYGNEVMVEPIGNHCRGTEFQDANDLLTEALLVQIDTLSKQIDGFYFGRFDIKTPSIADLQAGSNIIVLELNGISSEPGHIYDERHDYFYAYKTVVWHWKRIAEIARANRTLKHSADVGFWHILKVYFKHVILKKQ